MLVAQLVEQRTFNPWVGGSNPFGHTTQSAAFGQQPLALELLGGAEYFGFEPHQHRQYVPVVKSGKHASLRGWCRKALRVRFPPGTPKPMTDGFSIVCCLCPGGAILADAVVSEATAARRCEFESRPGHQNLLQTGVSIVCLSCPDGGTGRRAGFRVQCHRRKEGSNPFPGTIYWGIAK